MSDKINISNVNIQNNNIKSNNNLKYNIMVTIIKIY